MKVADLIAKLQHMPQDAEVYFAYDYGDHWHTTVAGHVRNAEVREVEYSEYHQMMKVVDPEGEDTGTPAVVLE